MKVTDSRDLVFHQLATYWPHFKLEIWNIIVSALKQHQQLSGGIRLGKGQVLKANEISNWHPFALWEDGIWWVYDSLVVEGHFPSRKWHALVRKNTRLSWQNLWSPSLLGFPLGVILTSTNRVAWTVKRI